jgi:hypothetical protein
MQTKRPLSNRLCWKEDKENSIRYIAFQVELEPTPSPNIHIFLPSGIAVFGIDSWVERFAKIFQNIGYNQEADSSPVTWVSTRSQSLEYHPLLINGGDL